MGVQDRDHGTKVASRARVKNILPSADSLHDSLYLRDCQSHSVLPTPRLAAARQCWSHVHTAMYGMERTASACGSTLAIANYEEQEAMSTRTEMTVVG
jgi:hypothetical protein